MDRSSAQQDLEIHGACEHNLKNVTLTLPSRSLIVITGVSGSGKSSLAFDTVYAEGQRRYVESLSAYARQFLDLMPKPKIERIQGLSPAIAIRQKTISRNPRSTVGTLTEIYDYLRLLFARVGVPHSPKTGQPIQAHSVDQIVDKVLSFAAGTHLQLLSPWIRQRKGSHEKSLRELERQGFEKIRIDQSWTTLEDRPTLDGKKHHSIDINIDEWTVPASLDEDFGQRVRRGIDLALKWGEGLCVLETRDQPPITLSTHHTCWESNFSLPSVEPRLFSFNSPEGACPECKGLGVLLSFDETKIIPDHQLPLEKAIDPWTKTWQSYYSQILTCWAQHHKVDVHKPFAYLPSDLQKALLYGTDPTVIPMVIHDSGHTYRFSKPFEGIIPGLERRWKKAENPEPSPYQTESPCQKCAGYRLSPQALCVQISGRHIGHIAQMSIQDLVPWTETALESLSPSLHKVSQPIGKEIRSRLQFLCHVGVGYLNLDRMAQTLSGGESQLIRLASQIGSGLQGVLYVLDEPSIGLHQRDNAQLIKTMKHLRDLGNTVLVVEHDEDMIRHADHVIDMGPKAGHAGGHVVAQGTVHEVIQHPTSLTGSYLRRDMRVTTASAQNRRSSSRMLTLRGATSHNLKNITAQIPLGVMTTITGVSGSGKSSLVTETLAPALHAALQKPAVFHGPHWSHIEGLEGIEKVIDIDQNPIGRTPRSNPATYTGIFSHIRTWFSQLPEARVRGYGPGRFSFNVKGGRCEACEGAGSLKMTMHFLPDMYVTCDACHGARYTQDTLKIQHKGHSIADVLNLTVEEALDFFHAIPSIRNKLQTLHSVGLGYISLGQSATTFSGGEAQRMKLSKELSRKALGQTFYILVEPTTGLHFDDTRRLLDILQRLVDQGHTVLVVEHNLDVVQASDWVIDLGPEGGQKGGTIIDTGTPEAIAERQRGPTGVFLHQALSS